MYLYVHNGKAQQLGVIYLKSGRSLFFLQLFNFTYIIFLLLMVVITDDSERKQ